jgi:sulfide:quinone oxidoreductase
VIVNAEPFREFESRPARVVIAGGGVAGLEAVLALRALAEERVSIDVVAPQRKFTYRPLSVLEPFGGETPRFDLAEILADAGARHHLDAVDDVDAAEGRVRTRGGEDLRYDAFVIATGTRAHEAIPGALTFGADVRGESFGVLVDEIRRERVSKVVFALPGGTAWSLPLYELALNAASELEAAGATNVSLTLVTPEDRPLGIFGQRASDAVAELLEERNVALMTRVYPLEVDDAGLKTLPDGYVPADRVLALPRLEGLPVPGVPCDNSGFIPTDVYGLVEGTFDVYAAGDVTTFPVKQGGIAAEQADAVATTIAARAGAPVEPRPFRPVLRGMMLTGDEDGPSYFSAVLTHDPAITSEPAREPLWWPPAKLFGRYLSPYLARRGAPPAARPPSLGAGADTASVAFEVRLDHESGS